MNRYSYLLALGAGLMIAGLTAGLLLTNALGAGWVFLIDVGSAAAFAGIRGWQRFGREDLSRVNVPVPY
jgi:hypothetical protein